MGIDGERLLELHSKLILKSLVVVDPTLSPARYRLLETVREFALELLRARGEEADARTAHLRHFVQLAGRSHRDILDGRVDEWLARLSHEHANIDGALSWAKADGADDEAALCLAGALMLYGKSHGLLWLLAEWAERALDGVMPEASQTYVRALLCSGVFKLHVQDPGIEPRLTRTVALAARLGDRWAQGCASAYLAMWHANLGQLEAAQARAAVAAELAEAEADDWLRSLAGLARGWIAIQCGRHDEAVATLRPLRRKSFDLHQHTMIDMYLALSCFCLGRLQEAADSGADVIDLSTRTRHLRSHAGAIELASYLAMRTAKPEICARLLGKAAAIRERTLAPLFSFWIAHHEDAIHLARRELGETQFEAIFATGEAARDELVIEEARALLCQIAEADSRTPDSALPGTD